MQTFLKNVGLFFAALSVFVGAMQTVQAAPIFPEGQYETLDTRMQQHARQFYQLNADPFGLSLDVHPKDEEAVEKIDQFLAQTASDDFESVTGTHLFELLSHYGEYGDLGFFGGIAMTAAAYEYMVLKREGITGERLELARERVVRAVNSWHVFYVVTGGNGLVARGIKRLTPEDTNDPPLPTIERDYIELFDENGEPLPQPKSNGSFRYDNSDGVLPEGEWAWIDSCSKDQLVGQIFGMVALYDAIKDDSDIDQSLVTRMQEDALGVGKMLMKKRDLAELDGPVGQGEYDLIIMDADGRPTMYHDLNAKSVEKLYLSNDSETFNKFNTVMALAIIKGLHHVTGDPELEEYLYNELMVQRDYLANVNRGEDEGAMDYTYMGTSTNFDVPDMTAIALWLLLYLENDPEVTEALYRYLEDGWWNREDETHTAALCKQPMWNMIYMTLTRNGVSQELIDSTADLLMGFELGPYWNTRRENCDEDEIAVGRCIAVDGVTELILEAANENGSWMATEALHPSIRPPSNFDSRSNPFTVNGGGGLRLNPGGDLLASYWWGRYMSASTAGESNKSPFIRDHIALGGTIAATVDGDEDADDTDSPGDMDWEPLDEKPGGDGGDCRTAGETSWIWIGLGLGCLLLARKRQFVG